MTIDSFFLGGLVAASFMCVAAVVFFERKNPASSIAWVLLLIFLPGLGFLAYLFLGSGFRISKKKKYALKAINDALYDKFLRQRLNIADAIKFMQSHENAARLMNYLKNEGEGPYTCDNRAEVFTFGSAMFPRLIEDIENAQSHIHLLYFIFRNDEIGREIAAVLTDKARRGVEVRLIYDSVGARAVFSPPLFRNLRRAGGRVLGFAPVFSNINSPLRLNYRNHRKITVIDGRIGYVGGMNIGDEYMSRDKKLRPWRDTHLRLTGSAVGFLQERFLMDWGYASDDMEPREPVNLGKFFPGPRPGEQGTLGAQIVSSGPDTSESPIKSGLLALIYAARRNVYIQTPYFTPDKSLMDALRVAARADIDVRLMLPNISDHRLAHLATLGYARQALEAGVRVFLYNGFLHAKTVVSDRLITSIGTTNLTNRSFTLDFEINAFIYDQGFAADYEDIFLEDLANAAEITLKWFTEKKALANAGYNFARLFAPLM
ncbi:MAG: cardiolipin synthase [Candidatus Adiutrix sp.]|jgi:cardiolipin synthase|nr:cardiolipin synthase [Candidatus Adiutrix sp.]